MLLGFFDVEFARRGLAISLKTSWFACSQTSWLSWWPAVCLALCCIVWRPYLTETHDIYLCSICELLSWFLAFNMMSSSRISRPARHGWHGWRYGKRWIWRWIRWWRHEGWDTWREAAGWSTNQLLKRRRCLHLLTTIPIFLTKLKMESKKCWLPDGIFVAFIHFFKCFRLNFTSLTHLRIV